jgi:murein tripeptide amidase MpaA
MKLQVALLLLSAIAASSLPAGEPSRDNHGAQVLRVTVASKEDLSYLGWLQGHTQLDFWTEPRALGPVDILARRWDLPMLKGVLARRNLPYEVVVADVAHHLQEVQRQHLAARDAARDANGDLRLSWDAYYNYDEINAWLDSLAADFPAIASVSDVGTSFEGRTMKLLKLSTGGIGKDAIFTDGGIHAREWISPATVTYFIQQLVSGNDGGLLDAVDFYFMPSINPDGYAYTWSDDRLWRKTRSIQPDVVCVGADPNRNWDFHWMEGGASDQPCAETYAGPAPFSEVEMQVVRDQLLALQPRVYLTFHSYSQLWMYPWGWTSDLPDNWQDLDSLANAAVDALTAVHGTQYEVGSSTNTIYIAAGGSDDWALGAGGSEYAYTIELRDTGTFGFELPPALIQPTAEETWEGFKVVAQFIADN